MNIGYLAYPIDAVPEAHRTELLQYVHYVRGVMEDLPGTVLFDPGSAWVGEDPPRTEVLQNVNNHALYDATFMIAILPSWSTSIGVPQEIQSAALTGIPVFVYRDKVSYALMGLGPQVYMFTDIEKLVGAVIAARPFKPVEPLDPAREVAIFESKWQPPKRAYSDDAGFDLFYRGKEPISIAPGTVANIPCECRIQWPDGMWAMVVGRSSTFRDRELLVNISVIDPGYRGEMFFLVRNVGHKWVNVHPGERLAQIIPLPALAPNIDFEPGQVQSSERGEKGFGSSGR